MEWIKRLNNYNTTLDRSRAGPADHASNRMIEWLECFYEIRPVGSEFFQIQMIRGINLHLALITLFNLMLIILVLIRFFNHVLILFHNYVLILYHVLIVLFFNLVLIMLFFNKLDHSQLYGEL